MSIYTDNHVFSLQFYQVNLEEKIKEWSNEDEERKFFLRKFTKETEKEETQHLLYVHQEKWQRDLLVKYGSEICLLDATYKTTKYAVPLFFLCVKTNSGYAVVGKYCYSTKISHSFYHTLLYYD